MGPEGRDRKPKLRWVVPEQRPRYQAAAAAGGHVWSPMGSINGSAALLAGACPHSWTTSGLSSRQIRGGSTAAAAGPPPAGSPTLPLPPSSEMTCAARTYSSRGADAVRVCCYTQLS